MNPTLNVLDFGAIGDGTTDDTAAFQRAIAAAGSLASSTLGPPVTVVVPSRRYKFTGNLRLPQRVSLSGEHDGPAFVIADPAVAQIWGPTLMITGGAGTAAGDRDATGTPTTPFILFDGNNIIENLIFYYPNQMAYNGAGSPSSVQSYPYTLGSTVTDPAVPYVVNTTIRRCTFVNAYLGIWLHGGQFYLEDLKMGCLSNGVKIDVCVDAVFMTRVHLEPVWDQIINNTGGGSFPVAAPSLDAYYQANCTGFLFWRADGVWMDDCSGEGPNVCVDLAVNSTLNPAAQSTSSFGFCRDMYAEACNIGVRANSTGNPNGWHFTNYEPIQGSAPMIGIQLNPPPARTPGYSAPILTFIGGTNGTGSIANYVQINTGGALVVQSVRNYNSVGRVPALNVTFSASPQSIYNPTPSPVAVKLEGGNINGVYLAAIASTAAANQVGTGPGTYIMGPYGTPTYALTVTTASASYPTSWSHGL